MANQKVAEQESLGAAMNRTELFFERNGRAITWLVLALIVVAALVFGYRALVSAPRAKKAVEMMAQAQQRFEAQTPDFELALLGDANGAGFLDVAEQYGSTRAGNLAKHYAGICYLHMGDLEAAARYLAMYSPVKGLPGQLVNAQNYGLQGDVAVGRGDYASAEKFYVRAAEASDNGLTAPMYLRKAGQAAQARGDAAAAAAFYQRIIDDYPSAFEAREAEKLLGTVRN